MAEQYPDQLLVGAYYSAKELSGWTQKDWLESEPSWVVVKLKDGRLACVANADLENAEASSVDT